MVPTIITISETYEFHPEPSPSLTSAAITAFKSFLSRSIMPTLELIATFSKTDVVDFTAGELSLLRRITMLLDEQDRLYGDWKQVIEFNDEENQVVGATREAQSLWAEVTVNLNMLRTRAEDILDGQVSARKRKADRLAGSSKESKKPRNGER